jgi:polar amino acid transport system permease protein
MVAVLWYLLITSILNIGQSAIERYYGRGDRGSANAIAPAVPDAVSEQESAR